MRNIGQMMKQAQQLQKQMEDMQSKLDLMEVEGTSGGGMVCATVSGKGDLKKIKIDPSLLDPKEVDVLEDLIIAAFNDGKSKVDSEVSQKMSALTGGLNLPSGFKLPF